MTTPLRAELIHDRAREEITLWLSKPLGMHLKVTQTSETLAELASFGLRDNHKLLAWASGALIDAYLYIGQTRKQFEEVEISFDQLMQTYRYLNGDTN